jgi:hypothetical protein
VNIKDRIAKAEDAAGIADRGGAPCKLCAFWARVLSRIYGEKFAPLAHTPEVCASLRRNLLKAYGGGNDGGVKVAA